MNAGKRAKKSLESSSVGLFTDDDSKLIGRDHNRDGRHRV